MGLEEKLDVISSVSDVAAKEFQLERALNAMFEDWKTLQFEHIAYRYRVIRLSVICFQIYCIFSVLAPAVIPFLCIVAPDSQCHVCAGRQAPMC